MSTYLIETYSYVTLISTSADFYYSVITYETIVSVWDSSISTYVSTVETYTESVIVTVEWTTVTITTTTYFWSTTVGTYVEKPVEVRADVPKWVPVQWETETVYSTAVHGYETISVAVVPTHDDRYVSVSSYTAPVLISVMNEREIAPTANGFLHMWENTSNKFW